MERWATVKRLHQAALEREMSQRAAFLDEACAGDESLRREVESLLAYQDDAESFLESPAVEATARVLSEAPEMTLVGRTLSHYQVVSLLGAGGMGEVYLALDPRLDRTVALKILPGDLASDADRMQRFTREAKAASALNHPNVATIYDVGESDGVRFIAMEHVEGHTLAARIAGRPLPPTDIVEIAVQVADALDAAHAKGITHRDIKPANLMLTAHGRVKVLDFGIAKTTRHESRTATSQSITGAQTAVGVAIGSAPFMSPEQVSGREVDHRSDLFSVGVALYEMATGRLPFAGATTTETMERILHAQPESIAALNAAIPSELERITFKCLEKSAEERYQSARDLLADLRQLQQAEADRIRIPVGDHQRHNLPAQLTSFVGRRKEIDEIRRLVASTRLLTLTGAGGCGKTRLALKVAEEVIDEFRDGVWLVDLGPLSEPTLIANTLAATLGVRGGQQAALEDVLAEYFRPRRVLLVLDNCEHLIAACAQLVEPLLRAAPNLHVLATSREGLGVIGEAVWRVPSMSVSATSERLGRADLLQCEAGRLFADRAAATAPAFTITDDNAATVAEVCRRLDGIPLAIELSAVRLNVLSVDQINARLKDRFRLLTGGSRTAVARQRTLEATIDWSYDLLSEPERTLLCRLSVFPAGWTLEAAEDVCAGNGIEQESVLDLVSRLVDKSLVNVEDDTGNRRYRFLETVRQYGRERLVRSADAERVRDRHVDFFFALVQRAEPELIKTDQAFWLNRLQLEYSNLRSALEWCLEGPSHGNRALELAAALFWFWVKRGYLGEGREWLERALVAGSGASAAMRAKALGGLGLITSFQGDMTTSHASLEMSVALAQEAGDRAVAAWSLGLDALTLLLFIGDKARAASYAADARALALVSGELWRQGPALSCLAHLAMQDGDYDGACRLNEEALMLFRRTGDKWALEQHLNDLALFQLLAGQYARAEALCVEGIGLGQELADQLMTAYFIGILAAARAAQGHAIRSLRLWGAMQRMFENVGTRLDPMFERSISDRFVLPLKQSLGDEAFDALLSEGRAMSLAQSVQYALAEASGNRQPGLAE